MTDLVQRLAAIRRDVTDLKNGRVTHRLVQVATTDAATSTFAAVLPDGQPLTGIAAPAQFLPAPGQWVRLRLEGATPIYDPAGIAQDAITSRELSAGAVTTDKVSQDLIDSLSGATVVRQPTQPATPTNGRPAYWWQPDPAGGYQLRQYNYTTSVWDSVQFGNGAIDPNSLIASDVMVEGTVSAELLDAVLVLATAIIAGDPAGEHARLDEQGLRAFANDEGIPAEVGYFGRGFNVRNPATGDIVGGITDDGAISGQSLYVADGNPSLAGVLLSELLDARAKGLRAWGRWPATGSVSAVTDGELGFMELGFTAEPGRAYALHIEGVQPVNTVTAGGWYLRIRHTTDGSTPTTASTMLRQFSTESDVNNAWNPMYPFAMFYTGPAAGADPTTVRLLLSYAAGNSSATSAGAGIFRGQNVYFWVEDIGLTVPETGDETSGGGTASGGTAPPTGGATTKQNYVYEAAATWQRTWNQSGTVIADGEMQQGYGDSFNGIRRSAAGWTGLPTLLAGATITEVAFYIESYYSWNMSGGQVRLGMHGASAEPAAFPGSDSITGHNFPQRTYGSWIVRNDVAADIKSGAVRGISFLPPNTSATYYMKFRGEGYGSGRPRIRVRYTK